MSSSACQSSPEEDQAANQGYVLPEGKIMPNTVFVGGIDVRMDEIEIKEYFSRFGAVKEVKIITDRSGVSKGYGFVSYYDDVDVQKIVDSQIFFHGKKLKLGPAIRKQNVGTYTQPRPVFISNPMPHCPNMWHTNVPEPYVQQPPVFSPVAQYVQTLPYSSTTPVMYHQIPLGCQQPGYYQVPPQWPNGDQRSMAYPQAFSWNCHHGIEMEMASTSNDILLPETYIQEQNLSPVSTSPQKDRRVNQFRRSRPFMKPTFDKAGV
ncbi:deleted in azoospermia-like isoform X2 [Dendrobates tinctorius]|uniref:deleted in azoospermia-like isoform X2 n=1 Tax=Dendrobates tinctorius TaxID=92724 RepID=UPI003CCA262F